MSSSDTNVSYMGMEMKVIKDMFSTVSKSSFLSFDYLFVQSLSLPPLLHCPTLLLKDEIVRILNGLCFDADGV